MNESVATFLQEIGTFDDAPTGLSSSIIRCDESNGTWSADYAITLAGDPAGTARFQFIEHCDTIYFVAIELTVGANQGFMTRWLEHGDDVIRAYGVRRATTSPAGYAVNVFTNAGWGPNNEDDLGTWARTYTAQ